MTFSQGLRFHLFTLEESSDGTSEGSEDDTGSECSYSTDGEDQSGEKADIWAAS